MPDRAEQVATLLCLIPFGREEEFRVVELGSGEGRLAWSVLRAFPRARVDALDGSESMRAETRARIEGFAGRVEVGAFDLLADAWKDRLDGADVVIASLSVHHLDGAGKQQLFREAARRTSKRGSFLLADIVELPNAVVNALFVEAYDVVAERQSIAQTGEREAFDAFMRDEWNIFRSPEEGEIPSPLFDQLEWLREAGYGSVAPVWQHAGHAIYAGYKGLGAQASDAARLPFGRGAGHRSRGLRPSVERLIRQRWPRPRPFGRTRPWRQSNIRTSTTTCATARST